MDSGSIFRNLLRENFIFTPTVMIKRAVLEEIGGFDESYKICEDYKIWLSAARRHQIGFIDEPLVIRRRIKSNITADKFLYSQCAVRLFEELKADKDLGREERRIIDKGLGGGAALFCTPYGVKRQKNSRKAAFSDTKQTKSEASPRRCV